MPHHRFPYHEDGQNIKKPRTSQMLGALLYLYAMEGLIGQMGLRLLQLDGTLKMGSSHYD